MVIQVAWGYVSCHNIEWFLYPSLLVTRIRRVFSIFSSLSHPNMCSVSFAVPSATLQTTSLRTSYSSEKQLQIEAQQSSSYSHPLFLCSCSYRVCLPV